jgi:hypothetical protein
LIFFHSHLSPPPFSPPAAAHSSSVLLAD